MRSAHSCPSNGTLSLEVEVSTKATSAVLGAEHADPYTSLEYLVTPVSTLTDVGARADGQSAREKVANSLQALTNLVYLLVRDSMDEQEKRTTLTLMQAELAHLTVLIRGREERDGEQETGGMTQ